MTLAEGLLRNGRRAFVVAALAAGVVACSSMPTTPGSPLLLAQARVLVGGEEVGGKTLPVGHGQGRATRFEAVLLDGQGRAVAGGRVLVDYQRPGGMMHARGQFLLYDDGTHGDPVAGDGIYCFEDMEHEYGCSGEDMQPGAYHYEFFGVDHDGMHSNHRHVIVTLE